MSAAVHPDQFPEAPQFDPEFEDIMTQPITPTDVLAMYQAMYKRNKVSGVIPNMLSVQEFSQDQVRMALQICHEMNKVERHLGVQITQDGSRDHHVSKTLAGLYRATMLSIALRGTAVAEKTNFWKVGCIVMSMIAVVMTVVVATIAH